MIDDGLRQSRAFTAVHHHIDLTTTEQRRLQQVRNNGGVMYRAARDAVVLHIAFDVFVENIADDLAGVVLEVGNLLQTRLTGSSLVGHVQRQVSQA